MVMGISFLAMRLSKTVGAEADAILADEQTGGFFGFVLGGDVNPIITRGAGEDFGVVEGEFENLSVGDGGLGRGVGAGGVVGGDGACGEQYQRENQYDFVRHHRSSCGF